MPTRKIRSRASGRSCATLASFVGFAALAVSATSGGHEAAAQEGLCKVDSASLNFGLVQSLRAGWQPGVGEVVVLCRNPDAVARTFRIAVAMADNQPLENTINPHAPALKVRFFEDPGYRVRWGGHGGRQEGQAVGLSVDGMSEGTVRVPVYGMVFVPTDANAGDHVQTVAVSIRYSD